MTKKAKPSEPEAAERVVYVASHRGYTPKPGERVVVYEAADPPPELAQWLLDEQARARKQREA